MPLVGTFGYHNKYRQLNRNGAKGSLQFRDFSMNAAPRIRKVPEKWTPQLCQNKSMSPGSADFYNLNP